jgi:hypothetical protein
MILDLRTALQVLDISFVTTGFWIEIPIAVLALTLALIITESGVLRT